MKLLVVSGKKGSGKDTIAPLVAHQLTNAEPIHLLYADPLKDTVDHYIKTIRNHSTPEKAVMALERVDADAPEAVRQHMVDLLFHAAQSNPDEHSRSHSTPVVAALQFYGTEFRRGQDPDYWVKLTVSKAAAAVAEGKFPYITDARFPNEITGLGRIGALSLRLDVDAEEQARRLSARDGRIPTVEELNHVSETALDDFADFDIRVQTCNGIEDTMSSITSQLPR